MLSDISTNADVHALVKTFYAKVRLHSELGPIFNRVVEDWDNHIEEISKFWRNTLFGEFVYKSNPMKAHIDVDQDALQPLEQRHFGNWLELWFSTIDSMFEGDLAHRAKEHARNMAHILFMRIVETRKKGKSNGFTTQY